MEIVTNDGSSDAVVEEIRGWLEAAPRAAARRRMWSAHLSESQCMAFVNALFQRLRDHQFEDEPVAWVGELWSQSRGWTAHVWIEYREHRLEAVHSGATVSPTLSQSERRRRRRAISLEAYRSGVPIRWLGPSVRWLER